MSYKIVRTPLKRYILMEEHSGRVIDSNSKRKPLLILQKDIERRIENRRPKL